MINHIIEMPDSVFIQLQRIATPLVDNPVTVIERLLSFYEDHHSRLETPTPNPLPPSSDLEFDPAKAPDLRHTRVLAGTIRDQPVRSWNELTRTAHALALGSAYNLSIDQIGRISGANLFRGEHHDSGFQPIDGTGISIQGVNSKNAWQQSLKLAMHLGFTLRVRFRLHDKAAAPHRGATARIHYDPLLAVGSV